MLRGYKQSILPSARVSIDFSNAKNDNICAVVHSAETDKGRCQGNSGRTVNSVCDDSGSIDTALACGVLASAHFDPEDSSWYAVRSGERVAGPFELFCDVDDYLHAACM